MKTDTEIVDLPINTNSTITVEAEIMPTTSEKPEPTVKESTAITPIEETKNGMERVLKHYGDLVSLVSQVLQSGVDYGIIPGTKKPSLYKPGAEKIIKLFGLRQRLELISKIEDWTGAEHNVDFPLFSFHYKCQLLTGSGELVAEGEAVCSSAEWKYRKQGVQGIYNSINTICKMSQKRAMVGAVLVGCGASEFFTQDLEDFAERVNAEPEPKPQPKADNSGDLTKQELIDQSTGILEQLGWTKLVASKFAEKITGKKVRSEMSIAELNKLIAGMLQELEKIQAKQAS